LTDSTLLELIILTQCVFMVVLTLWNKSFSFLKSHQLSYQLQEDCLTI